MSSDPLLPKGTDPTVQLKIKELGSSAQSVNHQQFSAAPTAAQVPEGGSVYATVSGTVYHYTKISGKLYRVAMTAA